MSKVLKALDVSEQHHQAMQKTPHYSQHHGGEKASVTNKSAVATLVLLPGLLAALYSSYDSYQDKLVSWLTTNQPRVIEVETPFVYSELPYPKFGDLTPTYEIVMADTALDNPLELEEPSVKPVVDEVDSQPSEVVTQEESLLGNLDLSELSPELALRIESALGGDQATASESNTELSNLAQQGDKWQGKLPALNFQTHVYSSNVAKRWVKVNGTEYNEGDWITDRIKLEKIEQNGCQIRFDDELIDIPALYDWQG
tara:strand:- start:1061 stop:1828 length:768 start_codon:yes stop_codon:yes gene_type:complete